MRRTLAFFVVAAVALALPAVAANQTAANPPQKVTSTPRPKPTPGSSMHVTGHVSKWDAVGKSFALKIGKAGKHEVQFVWNDKTKFEGVPAVGQAIDVDYLKEGLNTFVAEKITVHQAKPGEK